MACQYKNIFGKPNEGLHSYRIFDIAIIDVLATFIIAFILNYFFALPFNITLIVLFVIGIVFHRIFCVRTTIDKLLFAS